MKTDHLKAVLSDNTAEKTDPRTRYTQSIIKSVFFELIRQKPVSRITVSEICTKAGINRGTFYRYYMDVYDLAEQIQESALDHIKEMLDNSEKVSFETQFADVLRMIRDDHNLFYLVMSHSVEGISATLKDRKNDPFLTKVFLLSYEHFFFPLEKNDGDKARLLSYICGGTAAMITYWLNTQTQESPEEIAALIGQYAQTLIRYQEN